jgi:hypothetical protein
MIAASRGRTSPQYVDSAEKGRVPSHVRAPIIGALTVVSTGSLVLEQRDLTNLAKLAHIADEITNATGVKRKNSTSVVEDDVGLASSKQTTFRTCALVSATESD